MAFDSGSNYQGPADAYAQRRAYQRQRMAAQQQEVARADSLNSTQHPHSPPRLGRPAEQDAQPMPEAVRAQLDSARGHLGQWLPTQYAPEQLAAWRSEWLHTSVVGCELLEQQRQRDAKQAAAVAAQLLEQQQQATQARLQRELQERFRLPDGSVVRIKSLNSSLDGRLGRLLRQEWSNTVLVGCVVVDPLPPDHPMAQRPARFRPIQFVPTMHQLPMEHLSREHPEALG